jgi:hypothetical protein
MGLLMDQLIACIESGMAEVTADDVTNCGTVAVDPSHAPNGKQSGIGSFFRQMNADGVLRPTGRVVKSKAPKRKGGMIQVWEVTNKGRMLYGAQGHPPVPAGGTGTRRRRIVRRPVPVEEVPVPHERRLVRRRRSDP